jgi:hypothetical protein
MTSTEADFAILVNVPSSDNEKQIDQPVPPFTLHTVRGKLVDPTRDLRYTSALIVEDDELAALSDPLILARLADCAE